MPETDDQLHAPLNHHVGDNLRTGALLVLAALATLAAMALLRDVLIPFVLAAFLALMLNPLVDYQVRQLKWARPLAVAATFTAGALVLAAAVVGVLPVAISAIADVGSYADHLRDTARKVLENLPAAMITPQQSEELANRINTFEVKDVAVRLLPFIGVAGGGLLTFLGNAGLVLVFLLFFLLGRGDTGRPVSDMRRQIELRIQAYLSVTLLISLATGFLVGLTLWLLGVPLAWLFGLLAFALNFIPTVGSAVATLLPIPVILFGSDLSPVMMTLALGVPAIIQFVLGNLVAPKLLGDRLQLSPIAVMLGLLLLGAIWGIVGMILSTPLLAIFKITLDRLALDVPMLQPLSRLLTAGPQ